MPKINIVHKLGTNPALDQGQPTHGSPALNVSKSYPSRNVSAASTQPDQGIVPVSATKVNLSRSAASSPAP